jgi:hypothetical protein
LREAEEEEEEEEEVEECAISEVDDDAASAAALARCDAMGTARGPASARAARRSRSEEGAAVCAMRQEKRKRAK